VLGNSSRFHYLQRARADAAFSLDWALIARQDGLLPQHGLIVCACFRYLSTIYDVYLMLIHHLFRIDQEQQLRTASQAVPVSFTY
jgi:hypothetical protein